MGCGASTGGGITDPRFSSEYSKSSDLGLVSSSHQELGGDIRHNSAMYDGLVIGPPHLHVQSAGPELARASWRLPDWTGPQKPFYRLEVDHGGVGGGYVEAMRGAEESHFVRVDPGCSLRLRVCAVLGPNSVTEWSNEVHFITQAAVPRKPEAPGCSIVPGTGDAPAAFQVSWAAGRDGGLPIESYDVQMETYDQGQQVAEEGAGVWITDDGGGRGGGGIYSSVYSGKETSCLVRDELGLLAVSRVRFRVQAKNAMGYSEWSGWSSLVGEDENPLNEETREGSPVWPKGAGGGGRQAAEGGGGFLSVVSEEGLRYTHAPDLTNISPNVLRVHWDPVDDAGDDVSPRPAPLSTPARCRRPLRGAPLGGPGSAPPHKLHGTGNSAQTVHHPHHPMTPPPSRSTTPRRPNHPAPGRPFAPPRR